VGEKKKVANSVVALSSAAVVAIYGAGYARTRAAADRFAQQAAERRPHIPTPVNARESTVQPVDAPASPAITATALPPDVTSHPTALERVPSTDKRPEARSAAAAPRASAATPTGATPPAIAPTENEHGGEVSNGAAAVGEAATTQAAAPRPAPVAPPAVTPDPAKAVYKDGTYYGWGTSRHGDIQAAVVIESGRITVARVERCLTRYSCSWIDPIPPRILTKQGTTYDYVSGATESSDAFQDAISEALSQAK
jgi:uncharacterized protein with FMN-binding domain